MNNRELLKSGSEKLAIDLTSQQLDQFLTYMDMIREWNKKLNLTAITDEKEIIEKHFLDCLSIAKVEDFSPQGKLIDVGTGAGFPGIPLKIAFPDLEITLMDSLNKRLLFLEEVIKELGLEDIKCVHSRAEDLGKDKDHREIYDMCVSRAVAHLAVLCEYCLPFIKEGGSLFSFKGPDMEEELKESEKAISLLGGKVGKKKDVLIPGTDITHSIVQILKVDKTPGKYPRRAGTPSKKPLGIK